MEIKIAKQLLDVGDNYTYEILKKAYYKKLYGVHALHRNLIKKEEEIYELYEFKSFIAPMPYRKLKHDQYFIH